MAENTSLTKLDATRKSFTRFLREIRSELKKVVWLNRQQLINNTLTVLLSTLIIGLIIWIADRGLLYLSEQVFIK